MKKLSEPGTASGRAAKIIWITSALTWGFGCVYALRNDEGTAHRAVPVSGARTDNAAAAKKPVAEARTTASNSEIAFPKWQPTPESPPFVVGAVRQGLPKVPAANAISAKARVRLRFHALYRRLNLTSEEIEQFESAAASNYAAIDLWSVELGVFAKERESASLEMIWKGLERVARETLGEARVPAVREFVASSDVQSLVDKIAVNAFYADAPLTPAQAQGLMAICLANTPGEEASLRRDPAGMNWTRVLEQARDTLDPQQYAVLRSMADVAGFSEEFRRLTQIPNRRNVRGF